MQTPVVKKANFDPKDYCIEVRKVDAREHYPNHRELTAIRKKVIIFDIFVTKRSAVKRKDILSGKSSLITSPEFRDFLQNTTVGKRIIQQLANPQIKAFNTGSSEVLREPWRMHYSTFYPIDYAVHRVSPQNSRKPFSKKGFGALIDAQILKHLAKISPGTMFSYGESFSNTRKATLKRRGIRNPYAYLPVETQYKNLKKYLKKKSEERFAREKQNTFNGRKSQVKKNKRKF